MTSTFRASIASYVHPASGRQVPASDAVIFGSILAANDAEAEVVRDLTAGEARAALYAEWPHLVTVDVTLVKHENDDTPSGWCDIVPSYAIPR